MPWIEANGVSLRYAMGGAGPRTLVLLHEAGGCLESYDEAAEELEKSFRVLRYDQRGFGFSEKSRDVTFDNAVDDLAALLDGLSFKEPVHLAGCSLGGDIAAGFAIRYPSRVASLTITSPRIGGQSEQARMANAQRVSVIQDVGVRTVMAARHERSYPENLRAVNRERFARYQSRWVCNDPAAFPALAEMINTIDLTSSFPSIRAPTLVMGARLDTTREPELAERVAAAIPGARYILAETGHFMALQTPELFAQTVTQFIDSLAPSVGSG